LCNSLLFSVFNCILNPKNGKVNGCAAATG